jgi:membrane peptidoglycan carboxypeptidase
MAIIDEQPAQAAQGEPDASNDSAPGFALPWRHALIVVAGVAIGISLTVALVAALHGPFVQVAASSVDIDANLGPLAERSVVIAADGQHLATLHEEINRTVVPLEHIPEHVRHAVIAAEDRRFYQHGGYDLGAIGRAALANVQAGGVEQGASTITQQVAQQEFLGREQTLERKWQEIRHAVALEEALSKDEILERYLNQVYFGSGAYGIAAAAEQYFRVAPADLTLEQAALLAAIIRAPNTYNPRRAPEEAQHRRDLVLDAMAELGLADPGAAAEAQQRPVEVQPPLERNVEQPYVVEAVKRELLTLDVLGPDPEVRLQRILTGGLEIHVTVQPHLQHAAAAVVAEALPAEDGGPTAAIAAVDPRDGAIRALHGGVDFAVTQFDLAAQGRRQPGSALKPLVLAAALERGFSLDALVEGDGPLLFGGVNQGEPWRVENFEGGRLGDLDVRQALVRSANTAFAQIALAVGADAIVDMGTRLGIDPDGAFGDPSTHGPSIALGGLTNGVTPLELASAYGALADQGRYGRPWLVARVVGPDGGVLFERQPSRAVVVDPGVVAHLRPVLQQVVEGGTGTAARLEGWPVIGKTGTTQNRADGWFVGAVPVLSTAVWVGHPEGQVPVPGLTGGSLPAQLWSRFMHAALDGVEPVGFADDAAAGLPAPAAVAVPDVQGLPVPDALVALNQSGLLAVLDGVDPEGQVGVQDPAPGTTLAAGSTVVLRPAAPPPPPPAEDSGEGDDKDEKTDDNGGRRDRDDRPPGHRRRD